MKMNCWAAQTTDDLLDEYFSLKFFWEICFFVAIFCIVTTWKVDEQQFIWRIHNGNRLVSCERWTTFSFFFRHLALWLNFVCFVFCIFTSFLSHIHNERRGEMSKSWKFDCMERNDETNCEIVFAVFDLNFTVAADRTATETQLNFLQSLPLHCVECENAMANDRPQFFWFLSTN